LITLLALYLSYVVAPSQVRVFVSKVNKEVSVSILGSEAVELLSSPHSPQIAYRWGSILNKLLVANGTLVEAAVNVNVQDARAQ
jgi:hypothetical protein